MKESLIIQEEDQFKMSPRGNTRMSMSDTMQQIIQKQIDDIREQIINYGVLPHRNPQKFNYEDVPDHIDILLFGPAGAGKTSLIKTFYRALHNVSEMPMSLQSQLVVKSKSQNEGTTHFTRVPIKPSNYTEEVKEVSDKKKKGAKEVTPFKDHQIVLHDTRGQIWMDEKEMKQLNLIIDGKVADKSLVEQRNYRYAYLLWEFWKRDTELFPAQIMRNAGGLRTRPHAIVFVFDGSMDEIPNGEEETKFYKDIINLARQRKYLYPQIVLTCVDKVETQMIEENPGLDDFEREQKLREIIDMKIEKVVLLLGVSRSSVHFVENYKSVNIPVQEDARTSVQEEVDPEDIQLMEQDNKNSQMINYRALRLLHECTQQAETYMISNLKERRRSFCSIM